MLQPKDNDYNDIKVELIRKAIEKHGLENLIVNHQFKSLIESFAYEAGYGKNAGKIYLVFYYNFRQFCDYEDRITDDWTGSIGKEIQIEINKSV